MVRNSTPELRLLLRSPVLDHPPLTFEMKPLVLVEIILRLVYGKISHQITNACSCAVVPGTL